MCYFGALILAENKSHGLIFCEIISRDKFEITSCTWFLVQNIEFFVTPLVTLYALDNS